MMEVGLFSYETAFSRNIGWVTEEEQSRLKECRIAVGGLGGVGGNHTITMARLGIGRFTITDLDTFDWPNLNRQAGAFASTMGRPKLDAMAETLKDINPDVQLHLMPKGIDELNIDEFLDGADLYMDSLDIFSLPIRRKVFARCRELGIPAVTAAPMGMGTAFLAFRPDSMSFEDYFCLEGFAFEDQILKYIVGVSPSMQQRHYLVDDRSVNLFTKKVPSTSIGIELAAGVACANAIKLILKRGDVAVAPRGLHFDAFRNKLIKTWRPMGNRNPLQLFMFWYIRRLLRRIQARDN
jgi:molybdopterin/thiamine biosynthesis adenylyltransferase